MGGLCFYRGILGHRSQVPNAEADEAMMSLSHALLFFRTRFYWWPFHPMSYVIANTGTMGHLAPMLVGWLAKALIVRYGGIRNSHACLPFFLGQVTGEYFMAGTLAIISIITKSMRYRTCL
jgi:hypothetical protein